MSVQRALAQLLASGVRPALDLRAPKPQTLLRSDLFPGLTLPAFADAAQIYDLGHVDMSLFRHCERAPSKWQAKAWTYHIIDLFPSQNTGGIFVVETSMVGRRWNELRHCCFHF
jgi:hypothetical protein